jgi:4-hydroxy-2-oxoheptanedioate aldolase
MAFGSDSQAMPHANQETCLLPQIESLEAVKNIDEILAVDGLGGIFVGPGDLSSELGRPGKFDDPELRDMVCACIAKSRLKGLHAGILVSEGPLLDAALKAGTDLCIIASDMGALINTWREQLRGFGSKVC